MKAVTSKDVQPIEWSGMQIASIERVVESLQVPLLPEQLREAHTDLELVQVEVDGAMQLSWGDLLATRVEPARLKKPRRKKQERPPIEYKKILAQNGGGEQYSFL